jgi:hypothetical protein
VEVRATTVQITPVTSGRELREFVSLPYRLHVGTPWIPPLRLERYAYLSRRLNPFFKHGDAQLFLARREGRVVGRISAQIDRSFNEFQGNRWGLFGFLEFEACSPRPRAGCASVDVTAWWVRSTSCPTRSAACSSRDTTRSR